MAPGPSRYVAPRPTPSVRILPSATGIESHRRAVAAAGCANGFRVKLPYDDNRVQVYDPRAMKLSQYTTQEGISYRTALRCAAVVLRRSLQGLPGASRHQPRVEGEGPVV